MTARSIIISFAILAGLLAWAETGLMAEQNVAQTEEEAADRAAEEVAEKAAEKAVEKVVEKAAEKAAEKVAEKVVEKAVEKAVEQAAEQVVKQAAEKAAKKEERPDKWKGPTEVHFMVFVIDIDSIDGAGQSFAANFFVTLRWKDERLAKNTVSARQISLEEVWNPRVLLVNQGGIVRPSLPKVVEVAPDGTVIYRQRYVGPLSQPLELSQFPMDQHGFTIQFAAAGYRSDELEFVPEVVLAEGDVEMTGGGISTQLSLPDWKMVKYDILPTPYKPVAGIRVPGFIFEFTAKRYFLYYLWQVVIPLVLIVMMSCTVFWIDPTNAGSQIGVATTSILTLIAYRFVLADLLPRLPYMTKMDYFILGSTLLVFMTLVEVIVTSSLVRSNKDRLARNIDRLARLAFPLFFLLVFGWFLFG